MRSAKPVVRITEECVHKETACEAVTCSCFWRQTQVAGSYEHTHTFYGSGGISWPAQRLSVLAKYSDLFN
jgi:hypothetical protein